MQTEENGCHSRSDICQLKITWTWYNNDDLPYQHKYYWAFKYPRTMVALYGISKCTAHYGIYKLHLGN